MWRFRGGSLPALPFSLLVIVCPGRAARCRSVRRRRRRRCGHGRRWRCDSTRTRLSFLLHLRTSSLPRAFAHSAIAVSARSPSSYSFIPSPEPPSLPPFLPLPSPAATSSSSFLAPSTVSLYFPHSDSQIPFFVVVFFRKSGARFLGRWPSCHYRLAISDHPEMETLRRSMVFLSY